MISWDRLKVGSTFFIKSLNFRVLAIIPFIMRFVALQNKNLFFNSFFPRNYESFVQNVYWTPSYTLKTYKSKIEKHKILKCVCLSSFWIGCAKKGKKIYPLNLSILQQITVNGVNFCTAYVFGRLDNRSLVFSILWLSPKIIAFHQKGTSLKWQKRKKRK